MLYFNRAIVVSFSDGVATRVHVPPFFTRYVTRVFKTGGVPPPQIGSRVIYPWIFHRLILLLFQHGRKMPPIWRPFTDVGDHYVRFSSRHGICARYYY
jgi:hypothetical protein